MTVNLLNNRREKNDRGSSLENRVSALENYIAMLIRTDDVATDLALAGTVTIGGRLCSTVASAINAVGELTASNFNTSTKEILGDFTFGASGAIKMITDVNNGLWLSPTGILGKKTGATTFSIDASGNATFGGTLVAASGTFGTVTAGSLTGLTITAGTVRTDSGTYPHAKMSSTGFVVNGQYMTIRRSDGTYGGELFASSANGLILSSFSGEQCYINGADNLVLNAGGGTLQLRHGNTTRAYTSSDSLIISSGMTLGGTRRTTWPSASSGANTALSNLTTTNLNQALNASTLTLNGTTELRLRANSVTKLKVISSYLMCYDDLLASGSGVWDLGSSTSYWGDVNYKTWQDRGCLGWFDEGVELRNGKIVSDCEALQAIKKHPTRKTVYGVPMLDYKTLPKVTYTPADEKIKDKDGKLLERKILPRDENDRPYKMEKDEKTGKMKKIMAEDGAEMTSMFSIMIGALKELDNRLKKLERKTI